MPTTRRAALAILAAPALLRPSAARAQLFSWRLGHTAPESFPLHRRLVEAAEEVREKTGGDMVIDVQAEGRLGSQIGLLNQVVKGGVELTPVTGQSLQSSMPSAVLPLIAFAWTGYAPLWQALDGQLGAALREQMAQRAGLHAFDKAWDFGFRVVTTKGKAIKTAADMKDLRLRTVVEPEIVALFQALKAAPVAMPLPEAFRSIRLGLLDGQEGVIGLVRAAGFDAVQDRCALTNHIWDGQWLCMNAAAWRRLADRFKTAMADAFGAAAVRQRADQAEEEAEAKAKLGKRGMAFDTVDTANFRAALREAGYYRDLKKRFGDANWDLLERQTGRLA